MKKIKLFGTLLVFVLLVGFSVTLLAQRQNRFVVEGDAGSQRLVDNKTGLEWQMEHTNDKTWQQALQHCEGSIYGDEDDWRLPNVNELRSLLDRTLFRPASSFPGMPSLWFWSSSSYVDNPKHAWYVGFSNGYVSYINKGDDINVRCVRGGEQ